MMINRYLKWSFWLVGLIFSASGFAGVIELNFPWGKENSCSVVAKYWDGQQKAYTCSQYFVGNQQPGEWGKATCRGNQDVKNLEHRDSRLDISTRGRCAKTYLTNLIGEYRISEDRLSESQRRGSWFVNETKVASTKFNNSIAQVGRNKPGWGAIDLRRFRHNHKVMIYLNKEANICVQQSSGYCRDREEANYAAIESD